VKILAAGLLFLSSCCALHLDPCCVESPRQVAEAMRNAERAEAEVKAGKISAEEGEGRLELFNSDARRGFNNYRGCR
jgi:hypothetical protein